MKYRERIYELGAYKIEAVEIAKYFNYGEETIKAIRNSKTETEVSNAMHKARMNAFPETSTTDIYEPESSCITNIFVANACRSLRK